MFSNQYSHTGELVRGAMEAVYSSEIPAHQQAFEHHRGQLESSQPQLHQQGIQQQQPSQETSPPPQQSPNSCHELLEIGQSTNQSASTTGKKREGDFSEDRENSKRSVPNNRLTSGSGKLIVDLPTKNRYAPLSDLDDSVDSNEIVTENLIEKTPPVFIHNAHNHTLLVGDLKKFMKSKFSTKQYQNKKKDPINNRIIIESTVRVQPTTIEDFRNLVKFCKEEHLDFHSFRDPTNRPLTVIIRGIPTCYSDSEVLDELHRLNYPVQKINRIYKFHSPTILCAVELLNNDIAKTIYKLNNLFNAIVKVEEKRKSAFPVQCKNCQRYGHSKNNCGRESRCVRCLGNHHYESCPLPINAPPRCINCQGWHRASFKQCPKLRYKGQNSSHVAPNSANFQQPRPPVPQATRSGPPPVLDNTNFPSLPIINNPRRPQASTPLYAQVASSNNINNPIEFTSQIVNNIISQVMAILVPQLQSLINTIISSLLPNGSK